MELWIVYVIYSAMFWVGNIMLYETHFLIFDLRRIVSFQPFNFFLFNLLDLRAKEKWLKKLIINTKFKLLEQKTYITDFLVAFLFQEQFFTS